MMRPTPRHRALAFLTVALLIVVSCLGDPTGPSSRTGGLALAPRYEHAMAAAIVDVSAVRVKLSRPGDATTVVDTVIQFPAGKDTIELRLEIPLERASEQFEMRLAMTNAQGDTVFRAGPILVTATSGNDNAPAEPTFTYVGVGANAAGVRFIDPPAAIPFGGTVTLQAEAYDGQENVIPGTPIGFELVNLADSVRGRITDARTGTFEARTQRGNVQVRAVLASGQSATHTIAVQPVPSGFVRVSGNAQNGPVGQPIGAPLVARVVAADELGVQDIEVNWHYIVGVDTVDTFVDTSDVNGLVQYTPTLPAAAGAHSVIVSLVSDENIATSFTVNAEATVGTQLAFVTDPEDVVAAEPFDPTIQVAIQDAQGNVITTATDVVTIALLEDGGPVADGSLTGTTSVAAVNGIATFTDLAVRPAGTLYTLRATSGTLTAAQSVEFTVSTGAAVALAFETQPPAGAVFGQPFTVRVEAHDAGGNPVQIGDQVTIALGANPGSATLGGTLSVSMSEHVAHFGDLTLNALGTGYTLVASAPGLTDATSNTFDVTQPAEVNAWINPAGGDWSNAANWSRGAVPSVNDTVWIKLAGTYTVTVDQPTSVGRVEIGGGGVGVQRLDVQATLTMSDSVIVENGAQLHLLGGGIVGIGGMRVPGHFGWEGGNLTMDGTIRVSGSMTIAGTANRTFTTTVIELSGLGLWTNTHTINAGLGATWRVLAGGNVDVQGDASWLVNQGGPSTLDVQGNLLRTTSAGTVVAPALAVSGTVGVLTGTLETRGTATSGGSINVSDGAALAFGAGTQTFEAGASVSGVGNVTMLVNSNVVVNGAWNVDGTTAVNGAFDYNGPGGQTARLELNAGRVGGSGELSVTEHLEWEAGDIAGGGGTTRVVPGATVQIAGNTARTFTNHLLSIGGTGSWSGAQNINAGQGAILRIEPTGDLDIDGTPTLVSNQGGVTTTQVQGLLRKSTAGTASLHGLAVSGELMLSGGTIIATGTGTSSGTITISDPGFLLFTGGTQTLAAGSSLTGDGWVQVGDGATVNVGGTWTLDGITQVTNGIFALNGSGHTGTLMLDGNGSRRGTGTLLVNTLLHWNSGDFSTDAGVTRVQVGANLSITGTSSRVMTAQTIEVAGTGNWSGNHTIFTGIGAVLRVLPSGQLAITGNGLMSNNQGGTQTIVDVQGALSRTTSTGLAAVAGLSVSGTLSVETGVLEARNDGTSSGALNVLAGAELRFAGGTQQLTATSSVTGAGLVHMTSGTVNSDGAWAVGGTTRVANGSLLHAGAANSTGVLDLVGPATFGGTGTMSVTGAMTWSAGIIDGGAGTVRVEPGATFTSSGTDSHVLRGGHIIDIAGTGVQTGNHTIFTGQQSLIRVDAGGTLDIQGNLIISNNQGGIPTRLINVGSVTRSTSAGMSNIGVEFVNDGAAALTVNSGMLRLSGGGSLGGTIATNGTGVLSLNAGAFALVDGLAQTGGGEVVLDGGTINSTLADTVTFERLRLNGGVFAPAGLVEVSDDLIWDGAAQIEGGTLRVRAGGAMNIVNNTSRALRGGATLENVGIITWTGDASIFTGQGARIINRAGAVFDWQGDGDLVDNQGTPQAQFINEGSLSRTGPGISGVGMFIIDTIGTEFRLEAGELHSAGGARFGGTGDKYTGGLLVISGGAASVISMADGTQWNADGGRIRNDGGVLTIDSASTVTIGALELRGGSLRHEGTLNVTGEFRWAGGNILSNGPVGDLGGTTAFGEGAFVVIDSTTPKALRENHRLVVPTGTLVQFGSSGNINAGLNAVIENHGEWRFVGTAQLLQNQGGEARFINMPSGSIVAGATSPAIMSFVLENNGGLLNAAVDTLVLGAGSVTAFHGTADVTDGLALRIQGGGVPVTATAPFTVNGDLHIVSGALDVGATTVTVEGDLRVTGGGSVVSQQPSAVLDVNGDATFNGAPVTMTAGRLHLEGDFTQAGGTASFAATGSHVTRFDGSTAQTVTFASPGVSFSRFQGIELVKGNGATDSLALGSDVYVMGSATVQAGRVGRTPPRRLVVAGDAAVTDGSGASFLRPFVLEVGGLLPNGTTSIAPDTLVLNRDATYTWSDVPSGLVHLRFNEGDVTFSATSAPGDLIVSNDAIVRFPAANRAIFGNLETRDAGLIQQQANSDVIVSGNATFAGGNTAGLLQDGRLQVNGNFAQGPGGSAGSYTTGGAHFTVIGGFNPSTISFANPTISNFDSLLIDKGQTGTRYPVTLLSNVRVTGGMTTRGGADITGPTARLSIAGGTLHSTIQTMSPTMQNLLALELNAAPTIESLVSPDTTVLNAGITALPIALPLQYRSIRINTAAGITFGSDTIAGDLDIANGTVQFSGTSTFRVNGNLTTRNTGSLSMTNSVANLTVLGDARFLGLSTAGAMSGGQLYLFGSFEQGGNASSFQASGTHQTVFKGSTVQSIAFQNPDSVGAASRFAQLMLGTENGTTQVQLLTPAFAAVVSDTSFGFGDVISSPVNAVLTTGRADFSTTVFDGARLALTGRTASHFVFGLTFQNQDPTLTQLYVEREEAFGQVFNSVQFVGPVPTTGFYIDMFQIGAIQSAGLTFNNSGPASLNGRYRLQSTDPGSPSQPFITWNGGPP